MQYLTEQDLMARCGLGQGVELYLSPEERLTPSDARRDNSASSGMITSTKTELQIPQ